MEARSYVWVVGAAFRVYDIDRALCLPDVMWRTGTREGRSAKVFLDTELIYACYLHFLSFHVSFQYHVLSACIVVILGLIRSFSSKGEEECGGKFGKL